MKFEKLKNKISDRPTNTIETGWARGNRNIFKGGPIIFTLINAP